MRLVPFSNIMIHEKFYFGKCFYIKIDDNNATSIPGLNIIKFEENSPIEKQIVKFQQVKNFEKFTLDDKEYLKIPYHNGFNAVDNNGTLYNIPNYILVE